MCLSSDTLNRRERHSFSWVSFYYFPMNVTAQLAWVMSYWMDFGNQHIHACIYTHMYIYTYIHIHTHTHTYTHVYMCVHVCAVCFHVYTRKGNIHQSTLQAQQENWCYPSCTCALFKHLCCQFWPFLGHTCFEKMNSGDSRVMIIASLSLTQIAISFSTNMLEDFYNIHLYMHVCLCA